MPSFNWFDIVLFFILLGSIVGGLRAGFARMVIGLAALIVGLVSGFWCYGLVAVKLLPYLNNDAGLANILGFLAIFVGVLIVGSVLSALLSRLFRWIGLSWFDHALGGIAGIVRGVLTITVLVDVLVAFTPSPPPAFLDRSRLLPYTSEISGWLIQIAPHELKDSFEQQMDAIRQFWAPEQKQAREQQI